MINLLFKPAGFGPLQVELGILLALENLNVNKKSDCLSCYYLPQTVSKSRESDSSKKLLNIYNSEFNNLFNYE